MCLLPLPDCLLSQEQAEEGGGHSSAAGGDLREGHQTCSVGSQEGDQSQNQSLKEDGEVEVDSVEGRREGVYGHVCVDEVEGGKICA